MGRYTDEELQIAKAVDLVDLAQDVSIPLRKKGNYFQVEGMSSAMIFNRSSWCRFSQQGVGGSTIDFLMYFKDMEYNEAVSYLLDFAGYRKTEFQARPDRSKELLDKLKAKQVKEEKPPFILPDRSDNCRRLYAYLMKKRGLSREVIEYWLKHDLMYESLPHHNIVFQGRDPQGTVRFANQRGTVDVYGKEPFKVDVRGNDKNYGVNLINPESKELNLYEAAIDAMSDMDFRNDYSTSILALGMLWDNPLEKLLEHETQIKSIHISLDNDLWGRKAAKRVGRKYVLAGYEVSVRLPPFGKDYNAFLKCERENRALCKQLNHVRSREKEYMDKKSVKSNILYFPQGMKEPAQEGRKPETAVRR